MPIELCLEVNCGDNCALTASPFSKSAVGGEQDAVQSFPPPPFFVPSLP